MSPLTLTDRFEDTPMTELTLKISGMTCGHCVAAVKKALAGVDGVSVDNVAIGQATVHFDDTVVTVEQVTQAVEDDGYAVVSTS